MSHLKLNLYDLHCIISASQNTVQIYKSDGYKLAELSAFPHGVNGPRTDVTGGDTPFGDYLVTGYKATGKDEPQKIWEEYGPHYFYLQELDAQESSVERAGVGWHGGGSGLGYPGCLADYQELLPTLGCIRSHNADLGGGKMLMWFQQIWKLGGKIYATVCK